MNTIDFKHMENVYYGNATPWCSNSNVNDIGVVKNEGNGNGKNETYWNFSTLNNSATTIVYPETIKVYTVDSSGTNTNRTDTSYMKTNVYNSSSSSSSSSLSKINAVRNRHLNSTYYENIKNDNFMRETERNLANFTGDYNNNITNSSSSISINSNGTMIGNKNLIVKHYDNGKGFSEHSASKNSISGRTEYANEQIDNFNNDIMSDCMYNNDTTITTFNKPIVIKNEHGKNGKGDGISNDEININHVNINEVNINKVNINEVNINEVSMNKINYDEMNITKLNIQNAKTPKTVNEKISKSKKNKNSIKEKKNNEISNCEKVTEENEIQKNKIGSMYVKYVNKKPLFYVNDEQYDRIIKRRLNRIKQDMEKNRKVRVFVDIRRKSLFEKEANMKKSQEDVPLSNSITNNAAEMHNITSSSKKKTKNIKVGISKKNLELVPNVQIKNENEKKKNVHNRIITNVNDMNTHINNSSNTINNIKNNNNNNNKNHISNHINNNTNNHNNVNTTAPISGIQTIKRKNTITKSIKKSKEKTKKLAQITNNNIPTETFTKKNNNVGGKHSITESNKIKKGNGNTKLIEKKKNVPEKKINIQKNNVPVTYPLVNNINQKTENCNTVYANYNVEQFNDFYRNEKIGPENNMYIVHTTNPTVGFPTVNNTNTCTIYYNNHYPEQQYVGERYVFVKRMDEDHVNYYNHQNTNYINGTYVGNHTNQFHF